MTDQKVISFVRFPTDVKNDPVNLFSPIFK